MLFLTDKFRSGFSQNVSCAEIQANVNGAFLKFTALGSTHSIRETSGPGGLNGPDCLGQGGDEEPGDGVSESK
jgi:hypothetical protein